MKFETSPSPALQRELSHLAGCTWNKSEVLVVLVIFVAIVVMWRSYQDQYVPINSHY
jgi:hypothetical protein